MSGTVLVQVYPQGIVAQMEGRCQISRSAGHRTTEFDVWLLSTLRRIHGFLD